MPEPGTVGCFGGMSLAAALSGYIVLTREARLGLNRPEVMEQESGIDEWDSDDRALVFAINGGEQRYARGLADALVEDDTDCRRGQGFDCKGRPAPTSQLAGGALSIPCRFVGILFGEVTMQLQRWRVPV
jgi:hypothetical protein